MGKRDCKSLGGYAKGTFNANNKKKHTTQGSVCCIGHFEVQNSDHFSVYKILWAVLGCAQRLACDSANWHQDWPQQASLLPLACTRWAVQAAHVPPYLDICLTKFCMLKIFDHMDRTKDRAQTIACLLMCTRTTTRIEDQPTRLPKATLGCPRGQGLQNLVEQNCGKWVPQSLIFWYLESRVHLSLKSLRMLGLKLCYMIWHDVRP